MPRWQKLYRELKDKNFEIVSVAQDTGGVKDAGSWIEAAKPEYAALIDTQHLVTRLYDMVNLPTAVWINENGDQSVFALGEKELKERIAPQTPIGRWRRLSSLWPNIFIAPAPAKPRSAITKKRSVSTLKAGTTNARRGRSRTPNAITGRAL